MQRLTTTATLLLALACASCGGGGSSEPAAGACQTVYLEPIVSVGPIRDGSDFALLDEVQLLDLKVDGAAPDLQVLVRPPARNVRVSGANLVCTQSCGFATESGRYSFTIARAGYQPVQVEVQANYASRFTTPGGCPVSVSGSTYAGVLLMKRE